MRADSALVAPTLAPESVISQLALSAPLCCLGTMPQASWKQPAVWAAALLVAIVSYQLARQEPAERRGGIEPGPGSARQPGGPGVDPAIDSSSRLRNQRDRGESSEQIAKSIARSLGHGFEMFTPDGRINQHLMETAGIPADKMPAVQEAFDEVMKKASASLRARMQPDHEKSDPAKRVQAFRIPAAPAEAERLLADFKQALVASCGETAAAILLEVYQPDLRFGGFGRHDLTLQRSPGMEVRSRQGYPDEYFETGDFYLQFVTIEAGTTTVLQNMSCVEDHESLRENYGTLLEPPPWK